jgi:hypothetical protein
MTVSIEIDQVRIDEECGLTTPRTLKYAANMDAPKLTDPVSNNTPQ